ncbi:uncharacterized protein LOC133379782 isoform X1 [Rhineura floridana]|uniref:uncharacterized protein LOC133379782 isoform X1 n=2 Tax=Rhineura floridana TaxID=261503 RepID=UPI002AC84B7E|nr:uncharacterized protein LOC133379782 isoform X1 [Rhineura floridana]
MEMGRAGSPYGSGSGGGGGGSGKGSFSSNMATQAGSADAPAAIAATAEDVAGGGGGRLWRCRKKKDGGKVSQAVAGSEEGRREEAVVNSDLPPPRKGESRKNVPLKSMAQFCSLAGLCSKYSMGFFSCARTSLKHTLCKIQYVPIGVYQVLSANILTGIPLP